MKLLLYATVLLCLTAAGQAGDPQNSGVGIVLGIEGDYIVARRILTNTPAAAQPDLHVGDRILAIAQGQGAPVEVRKGKLADAVTLIRGPKGSIVRLTVVSPGEPESDTRVLTFVRGEIKELAAWGDGALLTNGTSAPDIEMAVLGSQEIEHLSDYAGKVVVLEFWATWCGPCQARMAELQQLSVQHPEWEGKVVVLAASIDDKADTAAKHVKVKGWHQTHNVWAGIPARKAYHIVGIPTVYLINPQGKVVATNPRDLPESTRTLLH